MIQHHNEEPRVVVPGFNHDIPYDGALYHLQTEQLYCSGACQIVTEVYISGQIVASYRASWNKPVQGDLGRKRLATQVRRQHKNAIKCLLIGKLTALSTVLSEQDRPPETLDSHAKPAGMPKLSRVSPHHSASQDLDLRRSLIRFVRAVGEEAPQSLETLHTRLRSVLTAIAVMTSHGGKDRLRHDDLAELLMRRSETTEYLVGDQSCEVGLGLEHWQRFAELARIFAPVNQRATLRNHDLEALGRVLARWDTLDDRGQPPDPFSLGLLKSCWGRDAVLDALLEDLRELTIATLYPEVERVTLALGQDLT